MTVDAITGTNRVVNCIGTADITRIDSVLRTEEVKGKMC